MPASQVLPKFEAGKLHSGSSDGPIVKKKSQAIAIMLDERRRAAAGKAEYQDAGHRLLEHVRNRKKAS